MIKKLAHWLCLAIGLTLTITGTALASDFTILSSTMNKSFNDSGNIINVQLRMPYIKMDNADVARAINDELYLSTLAYYAPDNYEPELADTGENIAYLKDLSYELFYQNKHRIVIKISQLMCRPICSPDDLYFNFDLRNGHQIGFHEVLRPDASKMMGKIVHATLRNRYRKQIAIIKKDISEMKNGRYRGSRNLRYLQESLELNRNCLSGIKDKQSAMAFFIVYQLTSRFFDDRVEFTNFPCAYPDEAHLDEVSSTDFTFSYASLRPFMTAYGRTMLLNEGDATGTDWRGQILTGRVDKTPVKMRVYETYKDGFIGYFGVADMDGQSHQFTGDMSDGQLILYSLFDTDDKKIHVKLKQTGNELIGEWRTKDVRQIKLHTP